VDDTFVPEEIGREVSRTDRPLVLPEAAQHRLTEAYQDDLRLLAASHGDLDLDRWPTFRRMANKAGPNGRSV
jgi:hypothetical protein